MNFRFIYIIKLDIPDNSYILQIQTVAYSSYFIKLVILNTSHPLQIQTVAYSSCFMHIKNLISNALHVELVVILLFLILFVPSILSRLPAKSVFVCVFCSLCLDLFLVTFVSQQLHATVPDNSRVNRRSSASVLCQSLFFLFFFSLTFVSSLFFHCLFNLLLRSYLIH